MAKIFKVRAGDEIYEVEEREDEKFYDEGEEEAVVINTEETEPEAPEALTADEIVALKKLAAVADKLAGLVEVTDEDGDKDEDEGDNVDVNVDVDTDEDEDEDEEKSEAKDGCGTRDSLSGFGSVAKVSKAKKDSEIDKETAIAEAWAKRFKNASK